MAQLNVSELDFERIKQSLKTYLQAQSEFSDYDFEGSALNVLLDTLAYNTHYNAILAHMQANESFLDTAVKRSSVVSIAKSLGYIPRSYRGSIANINLSVLPPASFTDTSYTLPRTTIFEATIDGATYKFYPKNEVTVTRETRNSKTGFYFDNLDIAEGVRVTNRFLVDNNTLSGPFTIPNNNVDTSTLRVRVQQSATSSTLETYTNYTNFVDVKSTTRAYYLEEDIDGLYTISFGDNIIGKQLVKDQVVILDYVASNGVKGNNGTSFQCNQTLIGSSETRTITTNSRSSGGLNKESIDSIRLSAPKYNQTRNRAVNKSDYEALIKASNSNISSCSVWGGEDNDPPIHGKVFISLTPTTGQTITTIDKDRIRAEVLIPKAPLGILHEFVDPFYTFIKLKTTVTYDPKTTTLSPGGISGAASSAIRDYFNTELNVLNKNFYLSKIHDYIKNSSPSIISVGIVIDLQQRHTFDLNVATTKTIEFNTKLEPRTLHTTWFNTKISSGAVQCRIIDVPSATVIAPNYNGSGVLKLETLSGKQVADIGTINYDTGKITINELTVTSYVGTPVPTFLRFNVHPHDETTDIKTQILTRITQTSTAAVVALPSRNTVLSLDDTAQNTTTGARRGLEVLVKQYVADE